MTGRGAPVLLLVLLAWSAPEAAARPMCTTPARRAAPRVARHAAPGDCPEGRAAEPSVSSTRHPITVHYQAGQEALAAQAIEILDEAWQVQVDELGWDPPLPDAGTCGSDDVDIFFQTGTEDAYTLDATANDATPYDDYSAYIVIDTGTFGEEYFEPTLKHEFNHVLQAAQDWYEVPSVYEMSATLVEITTIDASPDFLDYSLADFVARPELPVDHSDDFETFYMYGAAEYLLYLSGTCFADDPTYLARAWRAARSPAQGGDDPSLNEPDLEDGLDEVLADGCGVGFLDSVAGFRQAAWAVGPGSEIALASDWDPETTRPRVANEIEADELGTIEIPLIAAGLGVAYSRITWADDLAPEDEELVVTTDPEWTASVIEDDRAGSGTVVVAAWPTVEAWDEDESDPTTLEGTLVVEAGGESGGCGCRTQPGGAQLGATLALFALTALALRGGSRRARTRALRRPGTAGPSCS